MSILCSIDVLIGWKASQSDIVTILPIISEYVDTKTQE